MTIELRPELEALIQKRVASGVFANPEEVIERALEFLSTEEDWMATNRAEIAAGIEQGWGGSQAQRTHGRG